MPAFFYVCQPHKPEMRLSGISESPECLALSPLPQPQSPSCGFRLRVASGKGEGLKVWESCAGLYNFPTRPAHKVAPQGTRGGLYNGWSRILG